MIPTGSGWVGWVGWAGGPLDPREGKGRLRRLGGRGMRVGLWGWIHCLGEKWRGRKGRSIPSDLYA